MAWNGGNPIWLLQGEPPGIDEGLAGVGVVQGAAEGEKTRAGFRERPGASDVLIDEERLAGAINANRRGLLEEEHTADGAAIERIERAIGAAAAGAAQAN